MSSRLFASAVAFGPLTLVHDEGELLPDEWLVEANSTLQTVKEGIRLVRPLVGAALGTRWHPGCSPPEQVALDEVSSAPPA